MKCVFCPIICNYLSDYVMSYFYKMSNQGMLGFSKLVAWVKFKNVAKNLPLVMNEHRTNDV